MFPKLITIMGHGLNAHHTGFRITITANVPFVTTVSIVPTILFRLYCLYRFSGHENRSCTGCTGYAEFAAYTHGTDCATSPECDVASTFDRGGTTRPMTGIRSGHTGVDVWDTGVKSSSAKRCAFESVSTSLSFAEGLSHASKTLE